MLACSQALLEILSILMMATVAAKENASSAPAPVSSTGQSAWSSSVAFTTQPSHQQQQYIGGLRCANPSKLGGIDIGGIGVNDGDAAKASEDAFVITAGRGAAATEACDTFERIDSLPLVCVEAALAAVAVSGGSGASGGQAPSPQAAAPVVAAFDIEPPLCAAINQAYKYPKAADMLATYALIGLPPSEWCACHRSLLLPAQGVLWLCGEGRRRSNVGS
jgi:hypothetical protein